MKNNEQSQVWATQSNDLVKLSLERTPRIFPVIVMGSYKGQIKIYIAETPCKLAQTQQGRMIRVDLGKSG